jgi:hypothetical protein
LGTHWGRIGPHPRSCIEQPALDALDALAQTLVILKTVNAAENRCKTRGTPARTRKLAQFRSTQKILLFQCNQCMPNACRRITAMRVDQCTRPPPRPPLDPHFFSRPFFFPAAHFAHAFTVFWQVGKSTNADECTRCTAFSDGPMHGPRRALARSETAPIHAMRSTKPSNARIGKGAMLHWAVHWDAHWPCIRCIRCFSKR